MIDAPKPKNARISMLCYFDWLDSFELMSDEQTGKLIKYILKYGKNLYENESIEIPQDKDIAFAFNLMKGQIDRDYLKWVKKCEQNSENAKKKRTQTNASDWFQ